MSFLMSCGEEERSSSSADRGSAEGKHDHVHESEDPAVVFLEAEACSTASSLATIEDMDSPTAVAGYQQYQQQTQHYLQHPMSQYVVSVDLLRSGAASSRHVSSSATPSSQALPVLSSPSSTAAITATIASAHSRLSYFRGFGFDGLSWSLGIGSATAATAPLLRPFSSISSASAAPTSSLTQRDGEDGGDDSSFDDEVDEDDISCEQDTVSTAVATAGPTNRFTPGADMLFPSPLLPRAPPPPEEQERASANASSFAEVPLLPPAATCQQNSSGVIASAAATDITEGNPAQLGHDYTRPSTRDCNGVGTLADVAVTVAPDDQKKGDSNAMEEDLIMHLRMRVTALEDKVNKMVALRYIPMFLLLRNASSRV